MRAEKEYVLRHADGRFYSFAGGQNYDGPQFCRDWRSAKRFHRSQGKGAQTRLANPKIHGERFELVHISHLQASAL